LHHLINDLDIKQWVATVKLLLDKNTTSFKNSLVFGHTMAEALVQNLEALQPSIKHLVVASFGSFLQTLDRRHIKGVATLSKPHQYNLHQQSTSFLWVSCSSACLPFKRLKGRVPLPETGR
jgi:hypothetical protein